MIFISYASEDYVRASDIFDRLTRDGFDVWVDKKKIYPGQEWETQIWKAASRADIFCMLISSNSITKRGFVRKEMRFALDKWKEKLPEDIYLIPCRIEQIEPPLELKHLQYQDLIDDDDYENFCAVLRHALGGSAGLDVRQDDSNLKGGYSVEKIESHETGADIGLEFPLFSASDLINLNNEIISFVRQLKTEWSGAGAGSYVGCVFSVFFPSPRMVSILFSVHWHENGAAHPNQFFRTFNFDRIKHESFTLADTFVDPPKALAVLSAVCKFDLSKQSALRACEINGIDEIDDWIKRGASPDWKNFEKFIVKEGNLEILFNAYDVGPYISGPQSVTIELMSLQDFLSERLVKLLDQHT